MAIFIWYMLREFRSPFVRAVALLLITLSMLLIDKVEGGRGDFPMATGNWAVLFERAFGLNPIEFIFFSALSPSAAIKLFQGNNFEPTALYLSSAVECLLHKLNQRRCFVGNTTGNYVECLVYLTII